MPSELRQQVDQQKKEQTRQNLLDAAKSVFTLNGYHACLISDIVQKAGVGQGTFYRYFKNKREIFEALVEEFISQLFDEFSDMSTSLPTNVGDYRDASVNALMRLAKNVEQNRELVVLFMREAPAIDRDFENNLSEFFNQFAQLAKFYLDHAIERGFARPCNSLIVSQSIVGMGLRMLQLWSNGQLAGISIDTIIEEVVDFAFNGMGSRPEMQH